jgi:dTDP-glucose 4,6-dehydratase
MQTHDIPITRGAEFIGTNLAMELRNRGHQVVTADHSGAEEYVRGDVRNCRQVEKLFDDRQFDHVYHLAAEYGRWNGEDYGDFCGNLWTTHVIETKHVLRMQGRKGASDYCVHAAVYNFSVQDRGGDNVGRTLE